MQAQEFNQRQNLALGVMWGSVIGDVIGAHLEFDSDITTAKIKRAFTICGGGKHKLDPGQPTDDSQLSYALSKGLIRGKGKLNLNYIAQQMGNWFLSKPIDVGGTIRKSVPKACNMQNHQAHVVRKGAKQGSQQSQSNGTLMAIGPLCVWASRLSPQNCLKACRQYTILIHPNENVILANSFYLLAINYLMNHHSQEGRNINAYKFAKEYTTKNTKTNFVDWVSLIDQAFQKQNSLLFLQQQLPVNKKSGWNRIAFTYSFYYLVKGKNFAESIFELISFKGDTDTNACIMGALLGAYYGINGLNMQQQIEKISKWRPKNGKRPEWLVPGIVIQNAAKNLTQIAPEQLQVIGSQTQYKQKQKNINK